MNNKKLLVAIIIVIFSSVLLLVFMWPKSLEVSPKGENSKGGPVVVRAKENIDKDSGSHTITPSQEGFVRVVDNYIVFWPSEGAGGFADDQEYTVEFSNYKTVSGKPLDIPAIVFTVGRETPYTELQKEVFSKYGHVSEESSSNPFLEKLPHTEPYRYEVSYWILSDSEDMLEVLGNEHNWKEKKENYMVTIKTLVFQGQRDSRKTYINETKKARKEALKWITSQSVDTKKDINYIFIPNDLELNNP